MEKRNVLSTILASAGTALVWLPLLAPVLFAVVRLTADRRFRFDYLMPAELFPAVLLGGCLLLAAAIRERKYRRLIGWSLLAAIVLLIGGQAWAVISGLASGAIEPAGWQWVVVVASLFGYGSAVIALGAGGLLLMRVIFGVPGSPVGSR